LENFIEKINRDWENIKDNIKTSATESQGLYEMKYHKPWLDEKCLESLYQTKQFKMK
jgi:hypothetical protein